MVRCRSEQRSGSGCLPLNASVLGGSRLNPQHLAGFGRLAARGGRGSEASWEAGRCRALAPFCAEPGVTVPEMSVLCFRWGQPGCSRGGSTLLPDSACLGSGVGVEEEELSGCLPSRRGRRLRRSCAEIPWCSGVALLTPVPGQARLLNHSKALADFCQRC